jgi:hypothetical protein
MRDAIGNHLGPPQSEGTGALTGKKRNAFTTTWKHS